MSFIKGKRFAVSLPRWLLLLTVVLLLGACASQPPANLEPPPLLMSGPEAQVGDLDLLEVSPEMAAFLDEHILSYSDLRTRIAVLMNAVADNGILGFEYDEELTLNAADAFNARRGNCLSFANMAIAMARHIGLGGQYQLIFTRPEYSTREDAVIRYKHITVLLESAHNTYVMDVTGIRLKPTVRRRVISDNQARALYLNNIGADALINNDLPQAYAYMREAIRTEPMLTDSWVNMGVVFRRNGQLDDAERVFNTALEIDDNEYTAMSNLYEVYVAQGDQQSAMQLEKKVEKYRQDNPYYLLHLGIDTMDEGRYQESVRLLKQAIKKGGNNHQFYAALAKAQYLSGDVSGAQSSLSKAREIAPPNMKKLYDRSSRDAVAREGLSD